MENFPPKPLVKETPPSPYQPLLSLGLFILVFFIFFGQDLRLLVVFIGVLAIHEMGHFIMMRHFGYRETKMFFIPMLGAMVTGEKDEPSQKERTLVILAGPIPGIVFGLAIFFAAQYLNEPDLDLPAAIFLLLNLFNLLPFIPLDGGRLIETLFFGRNYYIQGFFLVLSSAVLILVSILLENYFLLIIPLFLMLSLSARTRVRKIRKTLKEKGLNFQQSYKELSNEDYWRIREVVLNQLPVILEHEPSTYRAVEQEDRIVSQVKNILDKPLEEDLSPMAKAGILILWLAALIGPILLMGLFQEGDLWKM